MRSEKGNVKHQTVESLRGEEKNRRIEEKESPRWDRNRARPDVGVACRFIAHGIWEIWELSLTATAVAVARSKSTFSTFTAYIH